MPIWRAGVCAPPEQLDLTVCARVPVPKRCRSLERQSGNGCREDATNPVARERRPRPYPRPTQRSERGRSGECPPCYEARHSAQGKKKPPIGGFGAPGWSEPPKGLALLTLPWLLRCCRATLAGLLPSGIVLLLLTRLSWLVPRLIRVVLAWLICHGCLLQCAERHRSKTNLGRSLGDGVAPCRVSP